MEFQFNKQEETYRKEVESFIKANMTPTIRHAVGYANTVDTPERQAFIAKMVPKGWLAKGFPAEYGGDGKNDPMAKFILNMQLFLAGAPIVGKNLGQVCGTLMLHGSEELKREFIARTLKSDIQWAIAYSEPEAGSDLSNMHCKAEVDGDDFVINGEKRWITSAHFADYFWLAVRTDANVPKHKGISLIIVEQNAPGITINPINMCYGGHRTNSVFFDNVRVPRTRVVGELNRGWKYMMDALNFERFLMTSALPVLRKYREFIGWAKTAKIDGKPLTQDPEARRKIARLDTLVEMARVLELRCICLAAGRPGYVPAMEASMNKALGAQAQMEMANVALDLMGPEGYLIGGKEAPLDGEIIDQYMEAGHMAVAAAGIDVAKNVIAKHYLHLPL